MPIRFFFSPSVFKFMPTTGQGTEASHASFAATFHQVVIPKMYKEIRMRVEKSKEVQIA